MASVVYFLWICLLFRSVVIAANNDGQNVVRLKRWISRGKLSVYSVSILIIIND